MNQAVPLLNDSTQDNNYPIRVRITDVALDLGSVAIPRIYRQFCQFLVGWNGSRLTIGEMFFIEYILTEQPGLDKPTFRLKDILCPFSQKMIDEYVRKFRRMGLFYTKAYYRADVSYGVRRGKPPHRCMDYTEWYFDPLFQSCAGGSSMARRARRTQVSI